MIMMNNKILFDSKFLKNVKEKIFSSIWANKIYKHNHLQPLKDHDWFKKLIETKKHLDNKTDELKCKHGKKKGVFALHDQRCLAHTVCLCIVLRAEIKFSGIKTEHESQM